MINTQVEEIKSKIDIIDLISEYISLKQAGANWKAVCPFHNEKTPSFMVSRDKQIWHCFGCNQGGDIFSFIQKIEGIEFPEALLILAEKAGVKLKKLDPTLISQKTKLFDIYKLTANFFHLALLKSKEAQLARDYVTKRNLSEKTIENFKLGYAPNSWDKLLLLLHKKGFKENDIFLSGLFVKSDKGQLYDRFRQRLMFPIYDHNGNILGFTGRILIADKKDQGGKYINTPQTLIYNKSLILYGLDKAKNEIKTQNLAVIVEGNMDVIASHQAGIKNVIASSGTALTLEQLKLLKRYTNNLALSFDADLAGQTAVERGIDTALVLGFNIKVIKLPEKINNIAIKDPDECINQGKEYWKKAIAQAVLIMDYYFDKVFAQYNKNNSQDRKEITQKLFKQIAKLPDNIEQDFWLSKLAQRLETPENILRESFLPFKEKMKGNNIIIWENSEKKPAEELIAEQLIALMFKFPQNINYIIDHLDLNIIINQDLQEIYKEIILYYNINKKFDYSEFEKILLNKNKKLVTIASTLLLLADKDFLNFTEKQVENEILNLLKSLKKSFINKKLKQLETLLAQAEKDGDKNQIADLMNEFASLTQEINALNI